MSDIWYVIVAMLAWGIATPLLIITKTGYGIVSMLSGCLVADIILTAYSILHGMFLQGFTGTMLCFVYIIAIAYVIDEM